MSRDVDRLTSLTNQQRQFLNSYLSNHNAISNAQKLSQAKDYDSRRGKILAELAKLPDLQSIREQLAQSLGLNAAPNQSSEVLDGADADADQGNFKRAYKALDDVKRAARTLAANYHVGPALDDFEARVQTLVDSANLAVAPKQQWDQWLQTNQTNIAAVRVPIDLDTLPLPADRPTFDAWKLEVTQVADAKAQQIEQFEATMSAGKPALAPLDRFLKTADATMTELNQEALQLLKGCRDQGSRQRLTDIQMKLTLGVAQVAPLQSLKVNDKYPVARNNARETQLKLDLDPAKASVSDLRAWIGAELANRQAGRDQAQGNAGDSVLSDRDRSKLRRERRGDRKLAHDEVVTNVVNNAQFDFSGLTQGQAFVLPDGNYDENSPDFQQLVVRGRDQLTDYLQLLGIDVGGQEFFDLKLKSAADLMSGYAQLVGWPADRKKWTSGQEAVAKAVAKGWAQAIQAASPSRLDVNAGQVTIPGKTYGNPEVIGRGGLGSIAKYKNPNDANDVIVVKSMLSQSADAQKELVNELKAHRRLMEGDANDQRRKNVVTLHDVVKTDDGAMHMMMELVDGGDLEENRFAMAVASDAGMPEQARSLLNQYMLKQAVDGVSYMRDQNLVHFDLKPDNMFLASDGTLKIADFGSARLMDGQGKVDDSGNQTPGYDEHLDGGYDTKTDTFSLGRTLGVLESMSPEAAKRGGKEYAGALTGAAGRLKGSLTDEDREKRPTLEGALDSAYLKNIEQFPPESLQELAALSVQYGKELKQHFKNTVKPSLALVLPAFAQSVAQYPDHDTFKEWMTELRKQVTAAREKVAGYKVKLEANPTDDERFKLQQGLAKDRARLEELEKASVSLGDSPALKELMQQIRDLTDQMTHHSEALGENEESDLEQVVKQLASAADHGTTFNSYVSLKANANALQQLGVDPRALTAVSNLQQIVLTEDDAQADGQTLAAAQQQIDALLGTIARNDIRAIVGRGLGQVLRDLARQFKANHGQDVPLTSEAMGHAALPKFDWNAGATKSWQDAKVFAANAGVEGQALKPLDTAIRKATTAFTQLSKHPGDVEYRTRLTQALGTVAAMAEALVPQVNNPAFQGFVESIKLDSQAQAELSKCNPKRLSWTRDPVQNWRDAATEAIAAGEAFGSPDALAKSITAALAKQAKWNESDQTSKRMARAAFDAYTGVLDLVKTVSDSAQTKGFKQYLADLTSKTEARRRAIQSQLENPTLV